MVCVHLCRKFHGRALLNKGLLNSLSFWDVFFYWGVGSVPIPPFFLTFMANAQVRYVIKERVQNAGHVLKSLVTDVIREHLAAALTYLGHVISQKCWEVKTEQSWCAG